METVKIAKRKKKLESLD